MKKISENVGVFKLPIEAKERLNDWKESELKRRQNEFDEAINYTAFSFRNVDSFVLNAARAVYLQNDSSNVDLDKEDVTNFDELENTSDWKFLIQVIGYYDNLRNPSEDYDEDDLHHIIADLSACGKIAEKYFSNNWIDPGNSLKKILETISPDFELLNELNLEIDK